MTSPALREAAQNQLHAITRGKPSPLAGKLRRSHSHYDAYDRIAPHGKVRRAPGLEISPCNGPDPPAAWGASLDGPGGQDSQLIQSLSLAFRASADVHWMHPGSGMQAVVLARTVEASQWASHMPRLVVAFTTEWPASVLHVNMDRLSPNARGGVGVGTIGKCGRRRFVWYLKVIGVPI